MRCSINVLRFSLPRILSISLRSFASIVKPTWCFTLLPPCNLYI